MAIDPSGGALIDPWRYAEHGYPHDQWTELRRTNPVHYFEPEGYEGFWAITKHADVCEISKQPERFLSEPKGLISSLAAEDIRRKGPPLRTLVNMDNPEHREYRAVASRWFTPRNVRQLEERMVESAQQCVDHMLEHGEEEFDFVTEVAAHHPLRLIAHLFGLPEEDEPVVLKLTNEIFGSQDPEFRRSGGRREGLAALLTEFFTFFQKLIDERRENPREDLASLLANAQIGGAPMGPVETLGYYAIVLTAGHETTRNALSGGLLALIEHPDEFAKLRRDPSQCALAADEIARWTTPVNQFARTATEDYELRGETIQAGQSVCLFYASANRDEEVFDDPFTFRVDREPNPHLGFGIGEHFCLGANLARLEIRVLLEEIVSRVEDVSLAGAPERLVSSFVGGVKHLPVRCRAQSGGAS